MKKEYSTSEIEIIKFTAASVITTSGEDTGTGDDYDWNDEF